MEKGVPRAVDPRHAWMGTPTMTFGHGVLHYTGLASKVLP